MAIALWGRRNSCNVQKPLWLLRELGVPFNHIEVGGAHGGLDDPAYVAMNPNRTVPTLCDGALALWESHAILRYLSAAYGGGAWWPDDPARRAIVDQWTDWVATSFQGPWINLFWLTVRTPADRQDVERIAAELVRARKTFAILDARLAETPFLAGDAPTYADVAAGVCLYRWMTMPVDRPETPNVSAWYERLKQRPSFVETVCIPYPELVGRLDY